MEHVPVELHEKILSLAYLAHGQYAQYYHRMGVLSHTHRMLLNEIDKVYVKTFSWGAAAEQHRRYQEHWMTWKFFWRMDGNSGVSHHDALKAFPFHAKTYLWHLENLARAAVFEEPCMKPSKLKQWRQQLRLSTHGSSYP